MGFKFHNQKIIIYRNIGFKGIMELNDYRETLLGDKTPKIFSNDAFS